MSADDRTPATLTPASRKALAHYRERADQCRRLARIRRARAMWPETTDPAIPLAEAKNADADAARWDALADELEAFGDQTDAHHEGQGELL